MAVLRTARAALWRIIGLFLLLESPFINCGQLSAQASTQAPRVVVLCNGSSLVSRAIADDYATQRGVRNILTIQCADSSVSPAAETISFPDFQQKIEKPLTNFLAGHAEIDFIVVTKGVPIRLSDVPQGDTRGPLALDSYLAALQYDKLPDAVRVDVTDPNYGSNFHGLAWANRFWNSRERFSHARFGGYLVTRLDAYSETEARALVGRALAAGTNLDVTNGSHGPILLDTCPGFGFEPHESIPHSILPAAGKGGVRIIRESPFGEFNADMRWAAELLTKRHVPVHLDTREAFVGHMTGLAGYVSWGSNDQKYDRAAYRSMTFAPGALVETAVSTSARTFFPTELGQSLIADVVRQGATGAKGYTDEPLLQAVASPSILFERYTRGWTLAESYYAASRLVGWRDIVLGDPLCRGYPDRAD